MQYRLEQALPTSTHLPWRGRGDSTSPAHSGRLVVLEGPDGAGKTTLAHEAVRWLADQGVEATFHASPGVEEGSLGQLVHRLCYRPADYGLTNMVDPLALQLLHVAAHLDGIPRILGDLAAGRMVVLDRCWWSTWAYGKATDVQPDHLETALELEATYWGETKPACLFLIERRDNEVLQPPGLITEYRKLAAREASSYPVTIVPNNASVEDATRVLVERLASTATLLPQMPPRSAKKIGAERGSAAGAGKAPPDPTLIGTSERSTETSARKSPLHKTTPIYDAYWRFASERQMIYFKRLRGEPPPWTSDRVLATYRFTNAYRAADRVSQYLIRNVIYDSPTSGEDTIFRILLFKLFNRINTWQRLQATLGEIRYNTFTVKGFSEVLSARADGERVYSAAYIMPPPRGFEFANKYENHLALLEHMMNNHLGREIARAKTLRDVYSALLSYSGIGPFLAYQFAIDLNYSELIDFSESDFVVAGPGARNGIRKCFPSSRPAEHGAIIAAVCDRQSVEINLRSLTFPDLWGRPLQWIDCQNLFCEIDKYTRVTNPEGGDSGKRVRIKQKYVPDKPLERPWFPPKWGINDTVERWWATRDQY